MKTLGFVALALACACAAFLFSLSPAAAQTLTWSGTSNAWDTTSLNWNGNAVRYADNDAVVFNDGASYPNIVVQSAGVQPASVSFATLHGGSYAYTFSGGPIGGSASVTLGGTGSVAFNSANTFTGTTTINGGVLTLGNSAALQNSPLTVNAPGGLAFDTSQGATTFYVGGLAGSSGSLSLLDIGGVPVTLSIVGSGSSSFSGAITGGSTSAGSSSLTVSGGSLDLFGNTELYVGPTTVTAGLLKLDFSQTGSATSNILNIDPLVLGGGTMGVPGSLGGGTLSVLGSSGANNSQTFRGLTLNQGCSSIIIATSGSHVALGTITRNPGSTLDMTLPSGSLSIVNGVSTTTTDTNGILGAFVTATTGGVTNWAASTGAAGYIFPYTAYTAVNIGTVATLSSSQNATLTGTQAQLTSAKTCNTLVLSSTTGSFTMNSTGALTLAGGGLINNCPTGSITGGTLEGSSGTNTLVPLELIVITPQNLTIGSVIADNGAPTALTKAGSGILALTGNNTYTGPTTVGAGTLYVGTGGSGESLASPTITLCNNTTLVFSHADALTYGGAIGGVGGLTQMGSGSSMLTLTGASNTYTGPTTVSSGTLQISSGSASGDFLASSGVSLSGSAALLIFNGSGQSTYGGVISGRGNLLQTGSGMLTLTGSNTYTGKTTVSACTLQVGNGGSGEWLSSGSIALSNNAALIFDGADQPTYAGAISGTGSLTQMGAGVLTLLGSNTFTGSTTISAGTLQLGNGIASGTALSSSTVANSSALVFDLPGSSTFSGAVNGSGSLTQAGTGLLTLTGSNSYTGNTIVSAGTLQVGNGGSGSATGSGLVTVNAGVLASDPKLSGTIGGNVVANSGGQIAPGGIGAVGALAILGNLSLNNGSTLDFDLSGGSADKLTIDGGLSVSGTANVLLSALSPSSSAAPYILATFASGSVNTSEFNVTGVPNGYTFKATSTDLELDYGSPNNSVLGVSASLVSFGRVMLNHVPTTNVTVSLTGGTSQTGFSVSASSGITATASGNGPGAIPPSGSVSIGLTSATGSYSGTIQVQNSGDAGTGNGPSSAGAGQGNGQSPISISVSGTVVDNRVVTATPANFGLVHVGAALSQGITLSTTGDDNHYTRVTVPNPSAPDANGMSITGGANPTFNGPAISDTRAVSGVVTTAGILNGTIIVATSGEGLTGEKPVSVPVSYSAQVFSGSGNWAGTSSSWSANGNWTDANGSGIQAAPGSFAGFSNTDTAVFSGSGSVTAIDLTGANPSLNSLSFSNSSYMLSNGSLTLNGGSGTASVTVTSGTQTINTPLTLASNTNFTINGGTFLLNSTISGSGGFAKSGSGGLTLPEGNTLSSTGSISIVQGTLTAPFGISTGGGGITFAAGTTLQAGETIKRAITGIGTVTATDDLTIGSSKEAGQFNQGGPSGVGGTLNVGGNAVILLSSDTAILGSQTNIGPGGSLTALNGTQLGNPSSVDSTKVLTAAGNATINANFVNNGVVNGPTGTGQELTFTQAVQGAGATTGNVEYAASYKVGNSPDAVSVQNVLFDPTSTLVMEFAGDVPGSGYDQLDISGMATLNGTLDVEFLAGYTPSIGDSYDILSGKTTGSFVNLDLASLPPGMNWDTSALYSQGVITVTPEPSSLALLAAFALGLAGYGLRRRAARTARPAAFDQQADAPPILAFPSQLSTASPARRAA